MTETWMILGATSGMAQALTRDLATRGAGLILAGRKTADMQAIAADATARGAQAVQVLTYDARDNATCDALVAAAEAAAGTFNLAVFVGSMPQQSAIDADPDLIAGTITDSLSGPAHLIHRLAPLMEARGTGVIVGVGSVAGDRGRLSNYVYGAAKAGFAAYLSGLRNRMARKGVHVMTVKPGPVDTPMTYGLPPMPFQTSPEKVSAAILHGVARRRDVIYVAPIWRLIMMVIRALPEALFKRTRF